MATGWLQNNGSWYYLNANGAMATGWLKSTAYVLPQQQWCYGDRLG